MLKQESSYTVSPLALYLNSLALTFLIYFIILRLEHTSSNQRSTKYFVLLFCFWLQQEPWENLTESLEETLKESLEESLKESLKGEPERRAWKESLKQKLK